MTTITFTHSPSLQSSYEHIPYTQIANIYRAKTKGYIFEIFCATYDIDVAIRSIEEQQNAINYLFADYFYYCYYDDIKYPHHSRIYFSSPDEQSLITKLKSIESLLLL